jgi:hypothetical protein
VTISPTFTRDPAELRASLPRAIAPDAPTPLWRAADEGLTIFKNREEDDEPPGHPGVERWQGQRSDSGSGRSSSARSK